VSDDIAARLAELEAATRVLEPDATRRAELLDVIAATGERYLSSADGGIPAYVETESPGAGLVDLPIGDGHPLDRVVATLEREVLAPGGHPASGGFLAYLTGGGLYHAALGDYLGAVTNKYPSVFFTGPGPVRMENQLVRWTADLVSYPAGAAGSIASGGSIANLTAVATARDAHGVGGANVNSRVVYTTAQAHHCIDKALRIAGLAEAPVRRIALDDGFRMRPDALTRAIAEDRTAGLTPWLIVATAGTTDVGAVDPLSDIADVAEREDCWLHVDAAYGGYFLLTSHGRQKLAGIERSDSVVLDPHKSLVLLGTAPFAAALDEKLLLARYFHAEIEALGFSVGPPPDLSVVTFRWAPTDIPGVRADDVNQAIVDALRRDGRIFLSSTELDGRFTIRMAALAHRTHRREVDLALRLLADQAAEASA